MWFLYRGQHGSHVFSNAQGKPLFLLSGQQGGAYPTRDGTDLNRDGAYLTRDGAYLTRAGRVAVILHGTDGGERLFYTGCKESSYFTRKGRYPIWCHEKKQALITKP